MDAARLIDSLVRQTTVLIAEVATASESRPRLARVADEVFRNLVAEFRNQGVSNKGIADMFGLTLRTYHKKMARLVEADAEQGRQLREDIYRFIGDRGSARRAEVLGKFPTHEPVLIAGLLRDLVTAELLFASGSGPTMVYRLARSEELGEPRSNAEAQLECLLWIAIQRLGPIGSERLAQLIPEDSEGLERALDSLAQQGRVTARAGDDGAAVYRSDECVIPAEDAAGLEAAVFDHFQAVVGTLAARLRRGARDPDLMTGGATFSFELWPEHPLFEKAVSLLSETRQRARTLREQVRSYNREHPARESGVQVVFYVGQSVLGMEEEHSHGS